METTIVRVPQKLTLWDGNFTYNDFEPTIFPNVLNPIVKLKFMVPDHMGQIPHIRRNLACDGPLCKKSEDLIHGHFFHCLDCDSIDLCEECAVHSENEHDCTHLLLSLHCRPHQPPEQSRRIISTETGVRDDDFLEYVVSSEDLRRDFLVVWKALSQQFPPKRWPLHEAERYKLRLKRPAENCSTYAIVRRNENAETVKVNNMTTVNNAEIEHHLEFYDSLPWSHEHVIPKPIKQTRTRKPPNRSIRRVNGNSGSDECFQLARQWLKECRSSHPECGLTSAPPLPTRVIDVQGIDHARVHLVYTSGVVGEYVALSYCWGPPPKGIQTLRENLREHQDEGLLIEDLPPTIRDAALATKALGFKYLWADRLCIVQDDAKDWAREASRMCNTYEDAVLTISADDSTSVWEGIFHDQIYAGLKYQPVEGYPGLLFRGETEHKGLDRDWNRKAPLYCRAWTLQERLMSRRILHFTSKELVWECNGKTECECRRQSSASRGRLHANVLPNLTRLYDEWRTLVHEYTSRSLTVQSDKLPALSGLVTRFQNLMVQVSERSDIFLAGLWRNNLASELAWLLPDETAYSKFLANNRDKEIVQHVSPETYIAPTWSWASFRGPVSYFKCYPPSQFQSHINIITASTTPKNSLQPNGQITDGSIALQGHVVSDLLLCASRQDSKALCEVTHDSKFLIEFQADNPLTLVRYDDSDPISVKCVLLGAHDVVEKVGTVSTISHNYPEARLKVLDPISSPALSAAATTNLSIPHIEKPTDENPHPLPDIFGVKEKRNLIRCAFFLVLAPSRRRPGAFERLGCLEVGKSRDCARVMMKIMESARWEDVTIV